MNSLETFFITLKLLINQNNEVGITLVVNGFVFEYILTYNCNLLSAV